MTMGVRIFLQNEKGEILLVKHGYVEGWHLPGGGVEVGDTTQDTVRKELLEETGIEAQGAIELFAVYLNNRISNRDHVLLYRVEGFKQLNQFESNWEIKEMKFFDVDKLPKDTTQSTRIRIDEILLRREVEVYW